MENRKIILSGIQPSGELHIGHLIGAVNNWKAMQEEYRCYYCVVDMHAITVRQDLAQLRRRSIEQIALYIACGLDPAKNIFFIQSHVPEHAQLSWVLNCYTMMGELSRMTQFKEKSSGKNNENINAGLFTYPILMAADILLYKAHMVPVGDDQKQHLELCRDIAGRFNGVYGDIFRLPEPYIPKVGARIMFLTDPSKKMSKSDITNINGLIFLLEERDSIIKKFKRAVTDSGSGVRYEPGRDGINNLITIYSAATGKTFAEIEREFEGKGYGDFKTAVGETVADLLAPIKQTYDLLVSDRAALERIAADGAARASAAASATLAEVYDAVGFYPKR